jgi:DNA polymerase-3 subunit delta'
VLALDAHPHAKAVLGAALPPAGEPSHAYLFTGPAGSGKRAAARAFAAALLAEGSRDEASARARVQSGAHPDLTWVTPSGAHEMRRGDVQEAVVGAASRTPFESTRRVFVIEHADSMNDEAANVLLKTLEEPPSYVVLVLLTDRPGQVLPTIASRCQPVRFDPLSVEALTERLVGGGVEEPRARACARLSLGDADHAYQLAIAPELRAASERYARVARHGRTGKERPWAALKAAADTRAAEARVGLERQRDEELQLLPKKDQRRKATEYEEAIKRAERRARTAALDTMLQLAGLWYRDLACLLAGAEDLVHNSDRLSSLAKDADGLDPAALREAVDLVEDTRTRLQLNVSEELALEALAFRLETRLA